MTARRTLSLVLLLTGFAAGYLIGLRTGENTESPAQKIEPADRATPSQEKLNIAKNDSVEVSPEGPDKSQEVETSASEVAQNLPAPRRSQLQDSYLLLEEEQNLVGIVDLILALIHQRRFPEANQLMESALEGLNGGKLNSPLWKNSSNPSFMVIRYCQNTENLRSVMQYVLYLSKLNTLPELLADLREEVLLGDTATMFLGLNDGSADDLTADLVPYYRDRIENWDRTTWTNRSVIHSLGLIPTDESAILIADLKDWTSSNLKLELIQALANNGSTVAVEVMATWLSEERNPRFKLALEDALRLLGQ